MTARERPENLAVLLREPFRFMTYRLYARLAERGYGDFRVAHGAVFQFLDDDGTSISELARRADVTKQSMAELVAHLEARGYVERIEDPRDRRSRPVKATARGSEVYALARDLSDEIEAELVGELGGAPVIQLRTLLERLMAALRPPAA